MVSDIHEYRSEARCCFRANTEETELHVVCAYACRAEPAKETLFWILPLVPRRGPWIALIVLHGTTMHCSNRLCWLSEGGRISVWAA